MLAGNNLTRRPGLVRSWDALLVMFLQPIDEEVSIRWLARRTKL
jgi:hypothetical protein